LNKVLITTKLAEEKPDVLPLRYGFNEQIVVAKGLASPKGGNNEYFMGRQ
jgi:hypothetical protein